MMASPAAVTPIAMTSIVIALRRERNLVRREVRWVERDAEIPEAVDTVVARRRPPPELPIRYQTGLPVGRYQNSTTPVANGLAYVAVGPCAVDGERDAGRLSRRRRARIVRAVGDVRVRRGLDRPVREPFARAREEAVRRTSNQLRERRADTLPPECPGCAAPIAVTVTDGAVAAARLAPVPWHPAAGS